jgi:hypothetical protein
LAPPPALVSAVPSIIFRVGFCDSAELKSGVSPDIYIMALHLSAAASTTLNSAIFCGILICSDA